MGSPNESAMRVMLALALDRHEGLDTKPRLKMLLQRQLLAWHTTKDKPIHAAIGLKIFKQLSEIADIAAINPLRERLANLIAGIAVKQRRRVVNLIEVQSVLLVHRVGNGHVVGAFDGVSGIGGGVNNEAAPLHPLELFLGDDVLHRPVNLNAIDDDVVLADGLIEFRHRLAVKHAEVDIVFRHI